MLFGFATVVRSFTVFVIGFLVFLLFRYKFIAWEEKALEAEFGQAYTDFIKRVRRWI